MNVADQHPPTNHRRSSPRYLLKVVSHLWASDVHQAAVERLQLSNGEHVLDLGAGLGPATIAASRQIGSVGRVTAIEPSRIMRVAIHLRRALNRNRQRIAVQDGLAEDLPVPNCSVDAVIALNIVHLLDAPHAAAAELARVLTSHGRVLFVEEDLEHPDHSFHEPTRHHGAHSGLGEGIDTMSIALSAAGLATTVLVDQIGNQPAHVITATPAPITPTATVA